MSNYCKPGILIDADIWQNFKEKVPKDKASETLQNIMADYQPPTSNNTSIIQVNKDIWQNFQNKYQNFATQEIERFMQTAISSPPATSATVMAVNSGSVSSMSIPSANNWTVTYASNSINLTQTSDSTMNLYNNSTFTTATTTPDIIINISGDK